MSLGMVEVVEVSIGAGEVAAFGAVGDVAIGADEVDGGVANPEPSQ